MNRKILIKNARAVITCDSEDTIHYKADILIDGPKILDIGRDLEKKHPLDSTKFRPEPEFEIIDADGCFIYPGLVNTHHHFFQTLVRNLTTVDYPSLTVLEWIKKIYEIFKRTDGEAIYYSSLVAMADLLKHGCTTAFDHQYCYPRHAGKELVDRQFDAADLLGIRYHAGRGANTLPSARGSLVPDEMVETTDEFLADCERLIGKYHDASPFSRRQIVISPCQPINCYRETFIESAALARNKKVRLHTHLGEGENDGMVERYGMRTLEWCESIGFTGPDVWYAHGWELTPGEYGSMAASGTGLTHCPAPAVLGGFPILDIPSMQKAGLALGLGCDGSATNDSSNLLDSLRMAYLMQAFLTKERGAGASAYDLLKIATAGGAAVLGRKDIGSLEQGKAADLFLIDASSLELAGTLHDPAGLIARAGVTKPVHLTMVNGRVVFRKGELAGIDEEKLAAEAEACCSRVIRKDNPAYGGFSYQG